MFIISDVKARGRHALKPNLAMCLVVTILFLLFSTYMAFASNEYSKLYLPPLIYLLLKFFVANPIEVGVARFFLNNRKGKASFMDLFYGFFGYGYFNVVKIMFFRDFLIAFWAFIYALPAVFLFFAAIFNQVVLLLFLLLLIPIAVKTLTYTMIPFLVADDCGIRGGEAFAKTKEMMAGNKMKILWLATSFIGWTALAILTLGLALPYLVAYSYASMVEVYYDLYPENK